MHRQKFYILISKQKLSSLSLLHLVRVGGGRDFGRPLGVSVEAAKTSRRLSAATPPPFSGDTGSGSDSAGPRQALTFCRDGTEAPASAWGGGREGGAGGGASVWSEGETERHSEYRDICQGINLLFFPHCCLIVTATFTQKVQKGQGQGQVFPSSRHDRELLSKFEEKRFTQKALFDSWGFASFLRELDRNWKTHQRVPDDTTCILHTNKSDW